MKIVLGLKSPLVAPLSSSFIISILCTPITVVPWFILFSSKCLLTQPTVRHPLPNAVNAPYLKLNDFVLQHTNGGYKHGFVSSKELPVAFLIRSVTVPSFGFWYTLISLVYPDFNTFLQSLVPLRYHNSRQILINSNWNGI